MRRAVGTLLVAMVLGLAGGCSADPSRGYSFTSPYRPDVQSASVEMFERGRSVYRREMEMRLTESVVKHIQLLTPYRIEDRAHADTLLTGRVLGIQQRVLSKNPLTGRPREMEVTMNIALTWQDLRTGEMLREIANLPVSGTYIPHEPLNQDFFQGSGDVLDRLGRRIVEQMESDW